MVAAGVATEDDVRRWDRAFQEVEAAPVPRDRLRPPVHRDRPPAGLSRAHGAYNRGNSQATQEATVPDNDAVTGADAPDALRQRWREQYAAGREREADFTTLSGEEVAPLYDPLDHPDRDVAAQIGVPGQYPFTRGVYPSMYRGRPWTIRQFSGFGNARETNERYKYLIAQGGGGLSVAFDMPTLMGRDSDDPRSLGEVGHCGVAVDSVADMEILFDGLPLDELTTSMTISGPAPMLFAMYLVAAERQGGVIAELDGTLQTDIFKEYIAQKEWLFPPEPHLRLIGDLLEFCAAEVPRYHPVSVSGYHIREAGATAAQELAFTLADGFAYVELGQRRGLDVDVLGPQLSFFFDAHVDFFEEIGKFRAARRIWARWMRERYGATTDKAMRMRFHTQTAGVSLTAQQPDNNVVRTAIEALSAVLGGTQSLHTNALDEVFALPTERAAAIALRTQQVIAEETGVAERHRPPRRLLVRRAHDRPDGAAGRGDLRPDRPVRRRPDAGGRARRDRAGLVPAADGRRRLPLPAAAREGREGHRRRQQVRHRGRDAAGDPAHLGRGRARAAGRAGPAPRRPRPGRGRTPPCTP